MQNMIILSIIELNSSLKNQMHYYIVAEAEKTKSAHFMYNVSKLVNIQTSCYLHFPVIAM